MRTADFIELFDQYNRTLEAIFARLIETHGRSVETAGEDQFVAMSENVLAEIQTWLHSKIDIGDTTTTPASLVDTVHNPNELAEIAFMASKICDDSLPSFLQERLLAEGQPVCKILQQRVFAPTWASAFWQVQSESLTASKEDINGLDLTALSRILVFLAQLEDPEIHEEIIAKLISTDSVDELILSAVREYFVLTGVEALPYLLDTLGHALSIQQPITGSYEHLLMLLAEIGKNQRSPAIFDCLRSCFRRMPDKVLGAVCLADYGDPRGIGALKSWLDRNLYSVDSTQYRELLAAIKKLGGDISDIANPFRNNLFREG